MGKNLAERFSKNVDERFELQSRAKEIVSEKNSEWDGVETVNVYSMPVAPLNTYNENSDTSYGPATILERTKQRMTVTQKPTFNMKIRRLDKSMDQMKSDAGMALSREVNQVLIPFYDHYVFSKAAAAAVANGNCQITTTPDKTNAYAQFLKGMEHLGNVSAPDDGRVAVCSYGFYNLLKQDAAFTKYSDASQKMLQKGIIGDVDGCKIMRVPNNRMPAGASCMIVHPYALTAPTKLQDFIIHDNPPDWSGWKIEGLMCFDAFVLNEKAQGIYYIGASGVNKHINVITTPVADNTKTSVVVMSPKDEGNTWKYATAKAPISNTNGAVPSSSATWTALTNGASIAPTSSGDTIITVVELDGSGKVVGEGFARINMA